ncbi:unnamed protein product [Cercospora beticola]|nr:unnamed protein product [Cercospora beticola]
MADSPSLAAPARNLTAATACGEAHRSGMSSGNKQAASPANSNQGGHVDGCHKYMRRCLAMSGDCPRRRHLAPMPDREDGQVAIRVQPSLHLKPTTAHRTWYVCLHVRTWIGSTLAATGCSPDYLRKLGRSR